MNELTPDQHRILVDAIHDSTTVVHKGRMMNERIKELALQAGYLPDMFGIGHWDMPECKKFAELIVQDAVLSEREACAMECIKLAHKWTRLGAWGENNEFHDCAAAIRVRGSK